MNKNKEYAYQNQYNELWLNTPVPERNLENILYNKSYFTLIDQCARGRGTHMTEDGFINHLIAKDRLIFVRDDDSGEYFSVSWAPIFTKYESYIAKAGINYQIYENITNGLKTTWRIYVPAGNDPIEIWDVSIENLGSKDRNVSIFTCLQMDCDGTETYCNFLFRDGRYYPKTNSIIIKQDAEFHSQNNFPYHNGFFTSNRTANSWDADMQDFVGIKNTIANPVSVEKGICSKSLSSRDTPTTSMQFKFRLTAGAKEDTRMLVGACSDESMLPAIRSKYLNGNIEKDSMFNEMCNYYSAQMKNIEIDVPEESMNRMLNKWVKHQILYGAVWCRWGYKGYRDIVQNSQNVITLDAELARKNLMKACRHQYNDGFALRGWHPLDTMRYVDSAQWLIPAVTEYVKETGDFALLNESVPYLDKGEDTVYKHLMQALIRLHTDRNEQGLCLTFFGDWNDSLTAVCRKGKGVSIWMSMAFCRSALLMKELAEYLGISEDAKILGDWHSEMSEAINKYGWDGKWYLCAIDDDGKLIGSNENEQGKIFLNMQSWAQLGRVVDEERWKTAIESMDEYLDSGWGYMLNWPTYTKPALNIGRLSFLQPGICENGSVYTHGNAFLILALLERGMANKALKVWRDINPDNNERPISCQTNVFINGYWGPDHIKKPGYAELPWITGSAGWMYYSVIEYMIGLRRGYNGITINPCIPSDWKFANITRIYRGTEYRVEIKNPDNLENPSVQTIYVNGEEYPSNKPLPIDGGIYKIEVLLGKKA